MVIELPGSGDHEHLWIDYISVSGFVCVFTQIRLSLLYLLVSAWWDQQIMLNRYLMWRLSLIKWTAPYLEVCFFFLWTSKMSSFELPFSLFYPFFLLFSSPFTTFIYLFCLLSLFIHSFIHSSYPPIKLKKQQFKKQQCSCWPCSSTRDRELPRSIAYMQIDLCSLVGVFAFL